MKNLVAFDLDGTLALSKQAIEADMGEALADLLGGRRCRGDFGRRLAAIRQAGRRAGCPHAPIDRGCG